MLMSCSDEQITEALNGLRKMIDAVEYGEGVAPEVKW